MKDLKPEVQAFLDRVSDFIDKEIRPHEALYGQQVEDGGRWCVPPIMEEMKSKARKEGLWNFFLPGYEGEFVTGLTNFVFAASAESNNQPLFRPILAITSKPCLVAVDA